MPILHAPRNSAEKAPLERVKANPPEASQPAASSAAAVRLPRLGDHDLELLTRNLQIQLSAGVPLIRALELQSQSGDRGLSETAAELVHRLEGGSSLGEALEAHSYAFSSTYRNLVQAGEFSGHLDITLDELGSFLAWRVDVKKTIRQASIYPTLVIAATFALVLFVLGFVFPKFEKLFERMGDALPPHVRVLMGTGDFVASYWIWIVLAAVAAVAGLIAYARTSAGRGQLYAVLCRLPVFGKIFRDIDLAMLMRNLALLEHAGVPLIRALELSVHVVQSRQLSESVTQIAHDLSTGDTFSGAIGKSGQLPPMVLNLVVVGEESGRLSNVLGRLAEHYGKESKESTQKALAFLEPAVTLALGLFVAGIAVTVISTLYQVIRMAGR